MKRSVYIVVFSLMSLSVVAQSNIRLNNYWGNAQYINPATVYDKYQAVFSFAARKQWIGLTGSPMTFFATASTYVDKLNTQFGLIAIQDRIGYTSVTNLDFTYAYAIKMEQDWQLHFGLGVNYQSLNYDISKVTLDVDNDPLAYQNLVSKSNFNSDIGVELTNKSYKFGAASQNIFSVFSTDHRYQTNTNFVYGRYRQMSRGILNMGFGVCGIQYSNMYQAEFNLTAYYSLPDKTGLTDIPNTFDIGVFYRTGTEAGVIVGFDLTPSIHLSYSYDYNISNIRRSSFGTNELMITYNLERMPVCHNCWH